MNKSVLVLMSAYNGSMYIKEQIRSIMQQETECRIDLRIRDDGSDDNTCEIIEEAQREYPGRVELVRGKRIGYNASFFCLLAGASGYSYYALSDQDDYWLPNKIQNACEHLDRCQADIPLLYASRSYLVRDGDMQPYGKTRAQRKELSIYNTIIQNICPGHTQVLNNALLELLKNDVDISRIYVYDAWITNLAVLYGKLIFNNNAYTLYRQHNSNQLGADGTRLRQLFRSFQRLQIGEGKKYRRQIEYFVECNREKLIIESFLDELEAFIHTTLLSKRIKYIFNSKLYRQSKIETLAFYCSYILGLF